MSAYRPSPPATPSYFVRAAASLVAFAARRRRQWFQRHPEACRSLAAPVISVGNLSLGGTGKTPVVASIARWLADRGERPAILSRGYGRKRREDGVVVVHDGRRLRADVARAGDEPLMIARRLGNVAVLVADDRYLAGRLAETRLGATVHLLDDGFQHVQLARDVDLVLLSKGDLDAPYPVPAGHLREPPEALGLADAVLLTHDADKEIAGMPTFAVVRQAHPPLLVQPWGAPAPTGSDVKVVAVAATARPQGFFDAVREVGWRVLQETAFRDHHRFTRRDIARISRAAEGADLVVTTEKDLMRLLPYRPLPFGLAWLPLSVAVEPRAAFEQWLAERLDRARAK